MTMKYLKKTINTHSYEMDLKQQKNILKYRKYSKINTSRNSHTHRDEVNINDQPVKFCFIFVRFFFFTFICMWRIKTFV